MPASTKNDDAGNDAARSSPGVLDSSQAATSSDGSGHRDTHLRGTWRVRIVPREYTVTRQACYRGRRGIVTAEPEEVIWPTWPASTAEETAVSGIPLDALLEYWGNAGDRLRESAKWMATVLGAAMAAVIGTSPLAGLSSRHLQLAAAGIGAGGLILLGVTMLLVLRVMQPQAVSYADIQTAGPPHGLARVLHQRLRRYWRHSYVLENPLYRWRRTVEAHQDLYLPGAVTSLRSLRRSITLEEATLVALAQEASERAQGTADREKLSLAQAARAARLLDLRVAAARIAAVGEYYALRARSTQATYGGIICGVLGTAAVVLAFSWPLQ
jgi:hypothetical protein